MDLIFIFQSKYFQVYFDVKKTEDKKLIKLVFLANFEETTVHKTPSATCKCTIAQAKPMQIIIFIIRIAVIRTFINNNNNNNINNILTKEVINFFIASFSLQTIRYFL